MQSIFAVYNRILEKVTNFTAVLAGILLFVPVFSIFYEVVSRGLFNEPTEWPWMKRDWRTSRPKAWKST